MMMDLFFLVLLLTLFYVGLWRVFTLAGERGWYALIPVWVFYCWARMVRLKHPLYYAIGVSFFIYGSSYVMPWFSRVFGLNAWNALLENPNQAIQNQIIQVSKTEFFCFGLFLIALLFGLYQYIRLCWRLAEAFSFRGWLAFLMILMPPMSLMIGLWIIILSKRPFKVLEQ